MNASPKTVLITGGAGFLGIHLCKRLLSDGHQVICADNYCTGSRASIAALEEQPGFTLLEQDVCDPISLDKVDQIYNLACPASPRHYQLDPVKTTRTSVVGALNLLELATQQGATILQASTSEIYGDAQVHPQNESYWGNVNPTGIRACYDEGKRCAESLFFDYHRAKGTHIRVARIFNTYGPGMLPEDGRVVSNFIIAALKGDAVTVSGEGTQTRSFCYVDDLIEGLVRLMNSPAAEAMPVNLGNPNEVTVIDLARKIIEQTGSHSELVFADLPQDDPVRRCPDIGRAKALLDWHPQVDLASGLTRTIGYCEKLLAGDAAGSSSD